MRRELNTCAPKTGKAQNFWKLDFLKDWESPDGHVYRRGKWGYIHEDTARQLLADGIAGEYPVDAAAETRPAKYQTKDDAMTADTAADTSPGAEEENNAFTV